MNAAIEKVSTAMPFNGNNRKKLAVKYARWNTYWNDYYRYGGVLYDVKTGYPNSIMNILERIINVDLLSLRAIDSGIINNVHRLLYRIAETGPYEISYNGLSNYLDISVNYLMLKH